VDDVLDVTADAETAGKSVLSDEDKTTFMRYYTPEEALALAARINGEAKAAIADLPGAALLIEFADSLLGRRS
jgi:geranylgeranyl pyrophosphate synthase